MRYRQVLPEGGTIQFKTDNRDLFEWSLFQFPRSGYILSEVTRDLHAGGICGVMTDYEEKFHRLGTPDQPLRSGCGTDTADGEGTAPQDLEHE